MSATTYTTSSSITTILVLALKTMVTPPEAGRPVPEVNVGINTVGGFFHPTFISNFFMLRGLLIRSYPFSIRTSVSYSTTASEKVPVSLPGPVRVGSVIRERYKLLHRIGSGGSSTVWLVWDQQCAISQPIFSFF
jgi:hypothetical protein